MLLQATPFFTGMLPLLLFLCLAIDYATGSDIQSSPEPISQYLRDKLPDKELSLIPDIESMITYQSTLSTIISLTFQVSRLDHYDSWKKSLASARKELVLMDEKGETLFLAVLKEIGYNPLEAALDTELIAYLVSLGLFKNYNFAIPLSVLKYKNEGTFKVPSSFRDNGKLNKMIQRLAVVTDSFPPNSIESYVSDYFNQLEIVSSALDSLNDNFMQLFKTNVKMVQGIQIPKFVLFYVHSLSPKIDYEIQMTREKCISILENTRKSIDAPAAFKTASVHLILTTLNNPIFLYFDERDSQTNSNSDQSFPHLKSHSSSHPLPSMAPLSLLFSSFGIIAVAIFFCRHF